MPNPRQEAILKAKQELETTAPTPEGSIDWTKAATMGALMGALGLVGKGVPLASRLGRTGLYGLLGAGSSALGQTAGSALPSQYTPLARGLVENVISITGPSLAVNALPSKLLPGASAVAAQRKLMVGELVDRQVASKALIQMIDEGKANEAVELVRSLDKPKKWLARTYGQAIAHLAVPTQYAVGGVVGHALRELGNDYVRYGRVFENAATRFWNGYKVPQLLKGLNPAERRAASRLSEYISQKTGLLDESKVPNDLKAFIGTRAETAAQAMTKAYRDIGAYMVEMGVLKPEQIREYYHPHLLLRETLMNALGKGEQKDLNKAILQVLEDSGVNYRGTKPFFAQERKVERLLDKLHELDPELGFGAYLRSLDKAAMQKAYGSGFKRLAALYKVAEAAGLSGEAEMTRSLYDRFKRVGSTMPEKARKAFSSARALTTALYMPLASISNATQSTQALMHTSVKGLVKAAKDVDIKVLKEVAPSGLQSLKDITLDTVTRNKDLAHKFARGTLMASGFLPTEIVNRVTSAVAGMAFIKDVASRAVMGKARPLELKKAAEWGIDLGKLLKEGPKSLTPEDLQKAAIGMERWTQYGSKLNELPNLWGEPWAKLLFQFKQYAYAQSRFVTEVGRSAIKDFWRTGDLGSLAPLAKMGLLTPALGYTVKKLRDKLLGQERELKAGSQEELFVKLSSYALGMGLLLESARNLSDPRDMAESVIPAWRMGSDVVSIGRQAYKNMALWKDNPIEALRYSGAGRIPLFAPFESRYLDPNLVRKSRAKSGLKME